jgi:FlaA1/EpsC-like NDP-sugar epimerase
MARRPRAVLITGGLGAIGVEVALWLAHHHPARVHLLGGALLKPVF